MYLHKLLQIQRVCGSASERARARDINDVMMITNYGLEGSCEGCAFARMHGIKSYSAREIVT